MRSPGETWVDAYDPDTATSITHEDFGSSSCTALFRSSARLKKAIDFTLSCMQYKQARFTAVSVGCSIGTDVDSIAAILDHNKVSAQIIGVDSNKQAIDLAANGHYSARHFDAFFDQRKFRRAGFEVSRRGFGVTLGATALRAKHNVEFVHQDLITQGLDTPPANLVTCNNTIYYVADGNPGQARNLTNHLGNMVTPGGILNLSSEPSFLEHSCKNHTEDWHGYATAELTQELGFKPVFSSGGFDLIFQKST